MGGRATARCRAFRNAVRPFFRLCGARGGSDWNGHPNHDPLHAVKHKRTAPGCPVLPAVYLLCLLAVAAHVMVTESLLAFTGALIFLTGWPLFLLGRRVSGGVSPSS